MTPEPTRAPSPPPSTPHGHAVSPPAPRAPDADPLRWLHLLPAERHAKAANLFFTAVRSGLTDPLAVVAHVRTDLDRRLAWATKTEERTFWCHMLQRLTEDPQGAQAYAADVVRREQLPPAEKAALKREKAKQFVLASMQGKEVTPKQLALLQARGYTGPRPEDRAKASALIDALLRQTGGGHV